MQREDNSSTRRDVLKFFGWGGALVSLEACIGPPIEWLDPKPAPLQLLTNTAIDQFVHEDYHGAEKTLMPARVAYCSDVGYIALLAIALSANKHYSRAETYFRNVTDRFEKQPWVITTIRDRIRPLFGTNSYNGLKPKLKEAAQWFPDLYVVIGFLELAEQNYDIARQAFSQVLPRHLEKKKKYAELFDQLARYAHEAEDTIAEGGYKRIRALFEDPPFTASTTIQ